MRERFADRADAGRALAAELPDLDPSTTIVVALPRGGVPVAAEICRATGLPLDALGIRKIGAPGQPELAVGAVADGAEPHFVYNREVMRAFGLNEAEVRRLAEPERTELARRNTLYRGDAPPFDPAGRTVVLVDDGVATGATVRAALSALRAQGAAHIVLALPVAPPAELARLRELADQTVCLVTPAPFWAVGAHYDKFDQTDDDEVIALLKRYRTQAPSA